MQLIINNEPKQLAATTVALLATELSLPERGVAVAVNNQVVARTAWQQTALHEGDNVTVIKAAFGG